MREFETLIGAPIDGSVLFLLTFGDPTGEVFLASGLAGLVETGVFRPGVEAVDLRKNPVCRTGVVPAGFVGGETILIRGIEAAFAFADEGADFLDAGAGFAADGGWRCDTAK